MPITVPLRPSKGLAVAYSGVVDSTLLLHAAKKTLFLDSLQMLIEKEIDPFMNLWSEHRQPSVPAIFDDNQ